MIAAGIMDTRITLLRPVRGVASGGHTVAYTEFKTVWANVRQLTFRESIRSQVELQTETYTLLMRYISGITPDWAVMMDGIRYRVISVNAERREDRLILGVELDNSLTQEPSS